MDSIPQGYVPHLYWFNGTQHSRDAINAFGLMNSLIESLQRRAGESSSARKCKPWKTLRFSHTHFYTTRESAAWHCSFSLGSQLKNMQQIPTCQPSAPIPGCVVRVTTIDIASSVPGCFSRAELPGVSHIFISLMTSLICLFPPKKAAIFSSLPSRSPSSN